MNPDQPQPQNFEQPQPGGAPQPVAPQQSNEQQPGTPVAPVSYPGKGLGIASFVVSLVGAGLVGLIMGIVALKQSKRAGRGNGFAIAGIVIGILNVLAVAAIIASVVAAGSYVKNNSTCMDMTNADGTVTKHCTLNGSES